MGATMQGGVAVPSMDVGGPAQWLTVQNNQPVITNSAPAAPQQAAAAAPSVASSGPSASQIAAQQQAAADAQKVAAINSAYGANNTFYQNELGQVAPQQQQDTSATNKYYDDQLGGLQGQRDAAFANLDQQTNVANQSYTRSLQQLGNSLRSQYQGGQNALGTQGAGDSSASNMLGYALGQQNNLQRGYMNQDLNNQLGQIGLTRDADQKQFDNQAAQVGDLRQQQLNAIAEKYSALVNQINGAILNNETSRKMALNYAGQWAANAASGVDQNVANALSNAKANTGAMPTVGPMSLQSYMAHNVVAPTVQAQNDLTAPQGTSSPTAIYSPYYNQNQNNQFGY